MSFIGDLFNSNKGAGFTAQSANQIVPASASSEEASEAASNAKNALISQGQFAQAAGAVNGLQNQQNIYNQLGGIASGQGPNPAQAMLAQQTGANVASQAALQAGQRGAGANAGLLARQIGQQGAATQQQAVGQGATLQAQQALNALGQQAGIAGQQVGTQAGALQGLQQGAQGLMSQQYGQINAQNQFNLSNTAQQNQANATIAAGNQKAQAGLIGGMLNGVGSAIGMAAAQGGEITSTGVERYASGGQAFDLTGDNGMSAGGSAVGSGLMDLGKSLAKHISGGPSMSPTSAPAAPVMDLQSNNSFAPQVRTVGLYARGGKVPALVSPGEKIIPKKDVKAVVSGKKSPMESKTVPGKPKVSGAKNSYANDTVPKTLNEGDIVLPRSVTQSKNPQGAAHKFVSEIMRRKGALK